MAHRTARTFARRAGAGLLAVAALGLSLAAEAVSIGDASLHSRLGEPLRVTIPLAHLGAVSPHELIVGQAGEGDYKAYGIDNAGRQASLKFEIATDAKGNAAIDMRTQQPFNEPLLEIVLEVRWPNGRAVREFTLLLDPPPK